MRIIVLTSTFLPVAGGAEVGIHKIYNRIGEKHDVQIVTRDLTRDEIIAYGAPESLPSTYDVIRFKTLLNKIRSKTIRQIFAASGISYLIALDREIRKKRPDVVNFQFLKPHGLVALWVRWVRRIPVVMSLVGRSDVFSDMGPFSRVHARITNWGVTVYTQNSAFYTQGVRLRRPVHTIPYGVDIDQSGRQRRASSKCKVRTLLGIDSEAIVLLAVQRLSRVKRVDLVIRMFADVRKNQSSAHLVIVGKGKEIETLQNLVSTNNIPNVHMVGYVPDAQLGHYYRAADIFVSHTMYETFGVVFAEAMAAGLPIVAADTSCISMVVQPTNGTLFTPGNIGEFVIAVEEYIRDKGRRLETGARNAERASVEFDWDRISEAYTDLFESVRQT